MVAGRSEDLSRRTILTGAIAAGVAPTTANASLVKPPNIVFILADDLGAFDLSCYGRRDYQTPNIDSIAQSGLKFRFGYANSSSCAPTRTALISGRYQNRYEIGSGEGGGYSSSTIGYYPHWPSLPALLGRAGYRTGLVGKWGLGGLPNFSPNMSGYDEFFGFMGSAADYWTHDAQSSQLTGERTPDLYENHNPVTLDGYATDLFSDRACGFIERNVGRPFLLSLHYTAPHWPWQTRDNRGLERQSDLHFSGGSPAIYGDMVRAMDDGVGRVLSTLKRHHLTRDTIVIFTSDNGGERFSKMWPLRGAKGDLWEGGTRVPLLISWPGRIQSGTETDQVAMSMDFLPTLAAIAGAELNLTPPPDGIDLSAQLLGAPTIERKVFWKAPHDRLSALAYPWKYLRLGEYEYLYDLAEDPSENANLKLREAAIFDRLRAEADAWSSQMLPSLPGVPARAIPTLEALEPLVLPE